MPEPDDPLPVVRCDRRAEYDEAEEAEVWPTRRQAGVWLGDTLWRDDGRLPSGDRFTCWICCWI